ncbi:MAG: PqqD family peptide modification chaperone, partial [Candidatus Theseobacter exili]|nr:PqqD family peptide modification chaperone [Candidatus Theseobacter exili]
FSLIKRIVNYAEKEYPGFFKYGMITNGTLMTGDMIAFFKKHGFSFIFSIDGDKCTNDKLRVFPSENQSVFDKAFGNLKNMIEVFPEANYKVNITYFKPTIDISSSFKFFLDCGIRETRFERGLVSDDSPFALDNEDIDKVKSEFTKMARIYLASLLEGELHIQDNFVIYMKKLSHRIKRYRGCNMGVDYLTVSSDGDVYPCHKLIGMDLYCVGNVNDGLQNEAYKKLWTKNVLQRPKCSICWARFICGGFCVCDNLHYNDDFLFPDEKNCELIKHIISLAYWLIMELEEKAPNVLKYLLKDYYMSDKDKPVFNEGINFEPEDKILRNTRTGAEYILNDIAGKIILACNGQNNITDLAEMLCAEYDVSAEIALYDVKDIISGLINRGVVRIR